MKSVVLLCTNLIFHCIAAKSPEVTGYFRKQGTIFGWAGCTKHSITILSVICAGILYYVPQSRYYTKKGCHLMIALVFGILKTSFSHLCGGIKAFPYSFKDSGSVHELQAPLSVPKDAGNDHRSNHVRRRHRIKQSLKTEDDNSRGHERKQHRHGERSRHNREEKYAQPGKGATQDQRFESTWEPTSDHLERKCDAYEDSIPRILPDGDQTIKNSESNKKNAEVLIRNKNLDNDEQEGRVVESLVMFPSGQRDCAIRAEDALFSIRKLKFQRKAGDLNSRKEVDSNDSALVTENEEVLAQLENQIMMLEKTVQAMQLGVGEKKVLIIEDILGEMKCSYRKIYKQMLYRRMESSGTEQAKDPTSGTASPPRNKAYIESDTYSLPVHRNPKEVTSDKDVKLSNIFLEDDEELPPIITNRIKPYLIKIFDWFFTGCPGERKYNVGKDGGGSFTAEPSL